MLSVYLKLLELYSMKIFIDLGLTNLQAFRVFEEALREHLLAPDLSLPRMTWQRWLSVLAPLTQRRVYRMLYPKVERLGPYMYAQLPRRNSVRATHLKMDVYRSPEAPSNPPIFMFIHGGAWALGHRNSTSLALLYHLAHAGWLVCTVSYRFSPRVAFPAHLIDCKRAVAFIRQQAQDLWQADGSFIAVGGESAGGHLAALLALTGSDPTYQPGFAQVDTTVQACVDIYGVHDFTDKYGHFSYKDPTAGFKRYIANVVMQKRFKDDPISFQKASPIHRVSQLHRTPTTGDAPSPSPPPPMMVVHGTHDNLVPIEDAQEFFNQLRIYRTRTGSKVRDVYVALPGAHHAFNQFASPRTFAASDAIERFLQHVHDEARPLLAPRL